MNVLSGKFSKGPEWKILMTLFGFDGLPCWRACADAGGPCCAEHPDGPIASSAMLSIVKCRI
jgi:hypothetical protein